MLGQRWDWSLGGVVTFIQPRVSFTLCCNGSHGSRVLGLSLLCWGEVEVSLGRCAPGQKSGSGVAVGALGETPAFEASAGGEDLAGGVPTASEGPGAGNIPHTWTFWWFFAGMQRHLPVVPYAGTPARCGGAG